MDRAPRARGRARPRRGRGRPAPRGDRDRRPHGARRRAGAALRASEGRAASAADQPVRHRAAHVPRLRRRALDDVAARLARRARDAAARGARREGARAEDAEVDRRLAAEASSGAARARRSCCAATTSTSAALPVQTAWPGDAGPFITLPAVITRDPRNGRRNVGMYRMQVLGPRSTAMHWQIHKDGRADYLFTEGRMEVAVALGLDPITRLLGERAAAEAHRRVDGRRLPARRAGRAREGRDGRPRGARRRGDRARGLRSTRAS